MSGWKRRGTDDRAPIIGLLTIELHFPHSRSLKQKRMVIKAIKDRLRGRFNVAVAETGYQDLWQRSVLSAVSVSSDRQGFEGVLEAMARHLESHHSSELVDVRIELIDSFFGPGRGLDREELL
ncbi:MAG: DUF503 domain-containing protein [Acidobacteriota bacterium]